MKILVIFLILISTFSLQGAISNAWLVPAKLTKLDAKTATVIINKKEITIPRKALKFNKSKLLIGKKVKVFFTSRDLAKAFKPSTP